MCGLRLHELSICQALIRAAEAVARDGDAIGVRCLCDLTRGGLSAALHEIASTAGVSIDAEIAAALDA